MRISDYTIKVPGNSGCKVEIISYDGKPAVRKSIVTENYAERLKKQWKKQHNFVATNKAIYIPKIIQYDDNSFTMEFLYLLDSIEYFETAQPKEIEKSITILFELIIEELQRAKNATIQSAVFLEKLYAIEKAVDPIIWSTYYRHHVKIIQNNLPETTIIPLGQCHGDMTFSNILFSLEEVEIGLIDFLDNYIETPIVDIVKLRQDTRFNWTNRRYAIPHDVSKVAIVMSWLDTLLEMTFNDMIKTVPFNILEKINYLRIAPYVQSITDHEWLSTIIDTLNKE